MAKYEVQSSQDFDYQAVSEAIIRMAAIYRDPFISIIGYSEALLEGLSGDINEAQRNDIEAIRTSGWQALGQLNDILDVMSLLSGEMEQETTPLNIKQLLQDVSRDVARTRADMQPSLKTEVADDLPEIEGDELRLRQAILGLVGSAVQDTPVETNVYLMASQEDDRIIIQILDGCEVANEDDLSYFFEPSWLSRLKNNRWRRMQWQSYLAHHLVLAHNGRIWVENVEAEGEHPAGTRVTISLPVRKAD